MRPVATTLCYPNPTQPTYGIFVQRRLAAIHQSHPLHVVAPSPVCPPLRRRPFKEKNLPERDGHPPVSYPSMFYLPGMLKHLDAQFYADALAQHWQKNERLATADVIDAHFVWPDGVGAWQVARQRRLPFVCTIRGKLVSQARYPARRRQIIDMLCSADRLIAVSQALADLACTVARRRLDVTVIPNGIDCDVFYFTRGTRENEADAGRHSPSAGVSPNAFAPLPGEWDSASQHVVSVGHLQELKGFHRLVEIWPAIRQKCGNVQLVLVGGSVGDVQYELKLHRLINKTNASVGGSVPAIFCTGRVDANRLRALLNAADLFALASRSEGWCNSIAEAFACGCPVIATDVGGNREQVTDPDLGSLVPFGNSEHLADAIITALQRDWDRPAIAEFGRRRNWSDVATQCVDVLSSVVK